MVFNTYIYLTLATLSFAHLVNASNFTLSSVSRVTAGSSTVVPGRYIVEFDSSAHLQSSGLKRAASAHEAIYNELAERRVSFILHQEYSTDVFIGASLSLHSQADLVSLASTSGVLNILPVHLITAPAKAVAPANLQWTAVCPPNTTSSANVATTTTCTGSGNKQTCTTKTTTSTSKSIAKSTPSSGFSANNQIQADRVQATGNKGKGIKIGIVDTGVDYTRTPLGGCFGSGCKIAGGYDFVGDNYDGTNNPVPDNDPFDGCNGHGTTMAGIIGANDNEYGVPGVASEASLYMYRVFSCSGATTDDIVIQGALRAYTDNMDVINLSLGETSGWTESALSVVISRLVAKGLVAVASSGNEGQVGAFYAASPADGMGVISVGSAENAVYPAQNATVSTGYGPITYLNWKAFTSGTYPLYALTTDPSVTNDACTIPAGTPNLAGYLVVVRRGGCSLQQKAQNLFNQGATMMFAVNTPGAVPLYQTFSFGIKFAFISDNDGNYLLQQIASGANTTVTFSFAPTTLPNIYTGNTTSFFSEIGPSNDLYMAASVLAPGTNIISILPTALGNWSLTEGTSQACAFAAGAAALYLNAKGAVNVSPKTVREAFEFSATQLPVSVSDSTLESVAAQGAGKIQIYDAINAATVVSPTELLLNDTAYFQSLQYITVYNSGSSTVSYKLSNVPAGTALAFQSGLNQWNDEPVPQVANAASVWFSQTSFKLRPGQTNVVVLKFTAPTGLDATTFPVYSGWIQIAGGSNNVQVPYMGVAAKMKNLPIIDPTAYYLGINSPTILDSQGNVQSGTVSYSFQNGDYPTVLYRLVGGTPIFLIDLIGANATLGFTPNYNSRKRSVEMTEELARMKRAVLETRRTQSTGQNPSSGLPSLLNLFCQLTHYTGPGCTSRGSNTFNKVPIIGNLYEADYIPRNTDDADGEGNDYGTYALTSPTFSNGTTIPNGTYKFLLRALGITGDRMQESDYEAWVSAPFTISP